MVYLLRRLQTDTNTLELLYSSLYGMHLLPSNRTGENPLWKSSEPYVSLYQISEDLQVIDLNSTTICLRFGTCSVARPH